MARRAMVLFLVSLAGTWILAVAPARAAATAVWAEDFSGCSAPTGGTFEVGGTETAKASGSPIVVDLYNSELLNCPEWTASGQAWLAVYKSGGSFPGSATRAAWLNESPSGSISRSVAGLTVGRQYRLSADAWTDNMDAPTALGLETLGKTLSMSMAAGTGVQQISVSFCATSTATTVRLFENGASPSSPVVTNITLEDMGQPCLDAVADVLSVASGGSGTVDVLANDLSKEGGPASAGSTVTLVPGGSAGGRATLSANSLTYVPLASESGSTVTVVYRLCPPGETEGEPCSEGTVTITVLAADTGGAGGGGDVPERLSNTGLRSDVVVWLAAMLIATGVTMTRWPRRVTPSQRSR